MATTERDPPTCPHAHGVDFDPLSPRQAAEPWPWLTAARAEAPVFYYPPLDIWCVTRYTDILEVLRDPRTFSSASANQMRPLSPRLAAVYPDGHPSRHSMLRKDPPEHTRVRKLVNKALTPKKVAMLEPSMRAWCHDLVDGFAARGRCDLAREFAAPLPIRVISDLLDVPDELGRDFQLWGSDTFTLLEGAPPQTEDEEAAHAERARRVLVWLDTYIDDRRTTDRGDLVSDLIRATGDDGEATLSNDEILGVVNSFLVAGVDTTAVFIPLLVRELLMRRGVWDALAADPSLVANAVEEGLRYWPPARASRRLATAPATIGGIDIPKGAALELLWISANHDESIFPAPEEFDLHRSNAVKHLGFGHGVHMCIGAPLARLELRIAIETLVTRFPRLRLAAGRETDAWLPNFTIPRLSMLEVEWDA